MDHFVDDLMEQVFQKGENEYALDEETRNLMHEIREKIKSSPRCQKSSSSTDEYFKNLQERLIIHIKTENDIERNNMLIQQYFEIINNKKIIESLCG